MITSSEATRSNPLSLACAFVGITALSDKRLNPTCSRLDFGLIVGLRSPALKNTSLERKLFVILSSPFPYTISLKADNHSLFTTSIRPPIDLFLRGSSWLIRIFLRIAYRENVQDTEQNRFYSDRLNRFDRHARS